MELTEITGIGNKRKKSLENSGIFSVYDLINFFPYKYYDFSKTEPFCEDGNIRLIRATVISAPKIVKVRASLTIITCKVSDENNHFFNAVWYNQTYIKSALFLGEEIFLYGKNSPSKKNTFIVSIYRSVEKQKLGYLPVYHTIEGIGQKILSDAINFVLEKLAFSPIIPANISSNYNLLPVKEAYLEIHRPTNEELYKRAIQRLELENFVPLMAINEKNKLTNKIEKIQQYAKISLINDFQSLLPFNLTTTQISAVNEIETDLLSKFTMNRLLQGDVGSGKTVVAFYGAFLSAKSGFQSAIIAPTEILAVQHYEFARQIFSKTNINVGIITGSMTHSQKNHIISCIKSGEVQIVIGTHSILSENVNFNNLAYIVIDEQHRFGVQQRKNLSSKGLSPDILVMSATPIPRSLSLIVYGELDLTILNSRPKPQNILTNIVTRNKSQDMWNYINEKLKSGSKLYVVCAKIDEENENDSTNKFSAKNMYDYLSKLLANQKVGLIYGKLTREKQNQIISDFKNNVINVLVSTTIVEVGVDIPDADLMVIATPERFGLATLHQLRGRIGRNGTEAHCFCLADNLNEKSYERILYFKNHSDGFDIAEFDLKTRGSGSIVGTNQHGNDNGLFGKISTETILLSTEILSKIKTNKSDYEFVLDVGKKFYEDNLLSKVIFN